MSIFSKPLSQITTSDLDDLLSDGAVENARLEFKSAEPNKDETLKKLSSFANTFGGLMVVGAKARSSDGRIESLPGVDLIPGYKQKVVDWCFNGAAPPLSIEVSDPILVPAANGKVVYVIYCPESDVAPHFLNGRKGIWVRTDEFSARFEAALADEFELRHLMDRRKAIRERRKQLVERARQRYVSYTNKGGPLLQICVVPRFPSRPVCPYEQLGKIISPIRLGWRGVGFPMYRGDTVYQFESAVLLGAAGKHSLCEVNCWGMAFYSVLVGDDDNQHRKFGIHLYGFVGYVLLFLEHASRVIDALGYRGSLHIEIMLSSVRGVPWFYANEFRGLTDKRGSELDDDVSFSLATSTEMFCKNSRAVAADVLRYIFFSVNWPDLLDTPQKLETLVRQGWNYNNA